jgi:hypothetical protein
MSFQPVGSQVNQVIVFNSGKLTVGGALMADVSDVTLNLKFDVKSYRTLNSIKKRAQRRATFDVSVSLTMFGIQTQVYQAFFSSSSPITDGVEYDVLDGQQTATAMILTTYVDDDPLKPIQWQLIDPIFSSNNVNLATEDFAQMPVEIMCKDILMDVATGALN